MARELLGIFVAESERSSTLDTLPEGKQVYSGSQSTYRKVHPDWKPSATIDKTDVVSAMEAVEGKWFTVQLRGTFCFLAVIEAYVT